MQCFRLIFDHLVYIERLFLSGIRDSKIQSVEPHVSHLQDQVRHCVWPSEGLFAYFTSIMLLPMCTYIYIYIYIYIYRLIDINDWFSSLHIVSFG